jgi:hypothetical protein
MRRRQEGRSPVTVLRYRGRDLGFEVVFDWREAAADVLVVRLDNGAVPSGGYYVDQGTRIRKHLSEVTAQPFPAETRRLRETYKLQHPDRHHRLKLQLDVYADVLRTVAGDVLRRGQAVFDIPDPSDRPRQRRLP